MKWIVVTVMLIAEIALWIYMRPMCGSAESRKVCDGCLYFISVVSLYAMVVISREQKTRWLEALAAFARSPKYWYIVIVMGAVGLILSILRMVIHYY